MMAQTFINIDGAVALAASLTVPQDRTFRGAWQFSGDVVEIDMAKARDIHRDACVQSAARALTRSMPSGPRCRDCGHRHSGKRSGPEAGAAGRDR